MSFIRANDHPNPNSPDDPLYYAPRSARSMANPRSSATPQTTPDDFLVLLLCRVLMRCARKLSPDPPVR